MSLCRNGHDLGVVGYYQHRKKQPGHKKAFRECKQCRRDRNAARKHNPPAPRERVMKNRDVELALELRARAEDLPHWDAKPLILEAEQLERGVHA